MRPLVQERQVSQLATGAARHKIVYVEDNPSNIAFMQELIDELPSVELVIAPNAESGLDLIGSRRRWVVLVVDANQRSGPPAEQDLTGRPGVRACMRALIAGGAGRSIV